MNVTRKMCMLASAALLLFSCSKERFIDEPGNLVPKTVDQDPSLPSISVNGALLHAEAFGHPDSTIVVCLHGGPGGDYRGLLNCRDLADHGYRVVLYDQRGSGLSQRFPKKYYADLGAGAVDVMYDELGGVIAHYRSRPNQKVFLFGHSWGAMLAAGYAGKHPDAVQGLVVAEPGGFRWDDVKEYVKASRSFNPFGEALNNVTYLDQFLTGKEDQHEILDYKLAMMASNNSITGENNTEPGSSWRSGAVILDALFEMGNKHKPDFSAGLSNFTTPTLFLYSEQNQAYPDSWAEKVSAPFVSKELFKITGTGHGGMLTDKKAWTEKTLPRILTYFNSL